MENIKVILFDVDGTLIDTDELIINSYKELFRIFRPDYKLTREEEISFLGPTLASKFPRYFKEDFQLLFQVYRNYRHKDFLYIQQTLLKCQALQYDVNV